MPAVATSHFLLSASLLGVSIFVETWILRARFVVAMRKSKNQNGHAVQKFVETFIFTREQLKFPSGGSIRALEFGVGAVHVRSRFSDFRDWIER